MKMLGKDFFGRKTLTVARELIGMWIVRKENGKIIWGKIIETEAYVGPHDLACHAARGRTKRTEILFGKPGRLYLYFVYGMHWMLNVVTEREEYPAAVLIRGIEDESGVRISGPGRVTKYLSINGKLNGLATERKTGLWFEDRGDRYSPKEIQRTPRIGVDYAGPIWAKKKYRFVLKQ